MNALLFSINISENGIVNVIIWLIAAVIVLWLGLRVWDLLGAWFRRLRGK